MFLFLVMVMVQKQDRDRCRSFHSPHPTLSMIAKKDKFT